MNIIRSIAEMQQFSKQCQRRGQSIGFVPTMGYLHVGHEQLMKRARSENDIVVTSIFVNPLQFGPNEDFDRYPRDEQRDIEIAKRNNVDVLFLPHQAEMYPDEQGITIEVRNRTDVLCGQRREGHFNGVVTVLTKLFHLTLPTNAYFGLKDAQQLAVVDLLVSTYNFPIKLVPVPTVREPDGLAMSSRNVYLTEKERMEAPFLYQALKHGQKLIIDGEKNPVNIVKEVIDFIDSNTHGKIDYVELLSYPDLLPIDKLEGQIILALAVHFQGARLIDNLILDQEGNISEQLK
ncbi:pantoate--beta-alanine ligase [Aquibacillus salsiterrae]|uniref:Pantothenate synthetase n=1 Tax=Aquibacillus salsiterrae TaxID=2950439 RepID=A0A9X3WAA0_9BACI|nr:pantoate--beta-alanine ligase [Aquibacillus salsiterrae]MDC3415352.1 pantoate--beta-alanine ligase [Aquibacillus salsiterrae]